MQKIIAVIVCWCWLFQISAQPNIMAAEYFIDTDPGFGNATGIPILSPSPNIVNQAFSVGLSSVSPGVHALYLRSKNASDKWSITNRFVFYKPSAPANSPAGAINKAEYFFDIDPGFGNGIHIPVTPASDVQNANFSASIAGLSAGVHTLYLRSRSTDGRWSITNSQVLYKPTTNQSAPAASIIKAEYFFDTDPGFGNGTNIPITPGIDVQNVNFAIDISTLSIGVHQLFIRSRDANGNWSVSNRQLLYKPDGSASTFAGNIVKAEYFFDTDPGFGNATNIPVTVGIDVQNVNFSTDLTALPVGVHGLFIRSQAANGKWSVTNRWVFYKPDPANALPPANITDVEYFIDADPGVGKAVPVVVNAAPLLADFVAPINISGLSVGNHRLFIRSKSATGKWSITNTYSFPIAATAAVPYINVNAITKTVMCAKDSVKLSFDARGTYNAGNVFNAELSDANGTFGSPTIIGTYTGTNSAIIAAKLPNNVVGGANFRVRVSSTNPVVVGSPNSDPLTVGNRSLPQTINGAVNVNGTMNYSYSVPAVAGSTWNWMITEGVQSTGGNSNNIGVTWNQPGATTTSGTIKLVETNYGCEGDTSLLTANIYKLRLGITAPSNGCKGFGITLTGSVDGAFAAGNTITAQLSDASGSFSTPVNVGSVSLVGNGLNQVLNINAAIPFNTPNGAAYRIRLVSSTGNFVGDLSGAISIVKPNLGADITRSKCVGYTYNLQQDYTDATLSYGYFTQAFGSIADPTNVEIGLYQVVATNSIGCKDTATITIANYPKPDLGPDQTISKCPLDVVDLTALFTTTGLTGVWDVATPAAVQTPGTYRLIVTNGNGCKDTAFVTVNNYVKPNIGADKSIVVACAGGTADITALYNTSGYTSALYDVATPQNAPPGYYRLIVTNGNGCRDTAFITVNDAVITTLSTTPSNIKMAGRECTDVSGWTHYYNDNGTPLNYSDDIRLMSLKKNGNNIGTLGDGTFEVKIATTQAAGSGRAVKVISPLLPTGNDFYSMNRYWNVVPTTQPTTTVGVRFYYNNQDIVDINGDHPSGNVSHALLQLYKLEVGNADPTSNWAGAASAAFYQNGSVASTSNWVYSALGNNQHQAEFLVGSFSGGGAGAFTTTVFPVKLVEFNAEAQADRVVLTWQTATEVNTRHFGVQRSLDGQNFTTIGQVAAAGNSTRLLNYIFTDKEVGQYSGKLVYYRLLQVDRDGEQTFTAVKSVRLQDSKNQLTLLVNPVKENATLKYFSLREAKVAIRISDAAGRIILQMHESALPGANQFRLSCAHLAQGIYTIEVISPVDRHVVRMVKE